MKIDVTAALDHPGERYAFSLQESPVDWESPLDVAFLGDISFSGEYWSEKGSVYITGKIAATVDAQCSRCLAPVEYPLLLSVEGKFARQEDIENDVYEMAGKQLFLDRFILDEISLALPSQYLCSSDCKGLCPKCGVNRNFEQCDCDISSNGLNPFEKLKGLF